MEKTKVTKKEVTKPKKVIKEKKVVKESFFTGVKKEMKKVRWPIKKEMIKYSIATLIFIIFFALFFTLGDLIIAGVKMLVA
ncbi:MAG: preprotein translocase subunit SecE [Bacilli bacterium]